MSNDTNETTTTNIEEECTVIDNAPSYSIDDIDAVEHMLNHVNKMQKSMEEKSAQIKKKKIDDDEQEKAIIKMQREQEKKEAAWKKRKKFASTVACIISAIACLAIFLSIIICVYVFTRNTAIIATSSAVLGGMGVILHRDIYGCIKREIYAK